MITSSNFVGCSTGYQLPQIEEAARSIDQRILVAKASTDEELAAAFAALTAARVGALLVAADPYFDMRRDRIVEFAKRERLPAIYQFREYAALRGSRSGSGRYLNSCAPLSPRIRPYHIVVDLPRRAPQKNWPPMAEMGSDSAIPVMSAV
jgi:hypothetical protein